MDKQKKKKKKKNANSQNTPKPKPKPNSSKSSKKVKAPKLRLPRQPKSIIIPSDSNYWLQVLKDQRFSAEIYKKVAPITMSEQRAFQITLSIVQNFENAMKDLSTLRLSRCDVSFRDGLYYEGNHIDLIYPLRSPNYIEDPIPRKVEQLLTQSPSFKNVKYTVTAQVPIIKLMSCNTHVDISFHKDKADIMNTKLMEYYVSLHQIWTYLILYLRSLLLRYGLHGTNKITTTVLFWLVIFFGQQRRSLPSVVQVRRVARKQCYVSGWQCSVPFNKSGASNLRFGNFIILLEDFFSFYRDYDFSKLVICPLVARSISISQFKNLQLPHDGFSVYVSKVRNGEIDCFPTSCINLQDPTLLGNNLAISTSANIVNRFKILCQYVHEGMSHFNQELVTKSFTELLPIGRHLSCKINNNAMITITPETFFTKRMQKRNRIKNGNVGSPIFNKRSQKGKRVDGVQCDPCKYDDYLYNETPFCFAKSTNSNIISLPKHLPSNAYTAVIKFRTEPKKTISSLNIRVPLEKYMLCLRRIRIYNDGGVLVQLYSKTDYDNLLQIVRDERVYDVEEKKPLQPQVIIHHIPVDYRIQNIFKAIQIKTNIDPIHIRFISYEEKRKRRSKLEKKAIVVCNPTLWRKLMIAEKIPIGQMICRIEKYVPVQRCSKCKLPGHIIKYCTEAVDYSISSQCFNCSIFNQRLSTDDYSNKARDINHSIFDVNCLTYKEALARTELLTDYVTESCMVTRSSSI